MSEEIKVSRECPHCHGSLERYEDPVAVEIINQRDTKIAALEKLNTILRNQIKDEQSKALENMKNNHNRIDALEEEVVGLKIILKQSETMLRSFRYSMDSNLPFPSMIKLDEAIAAIQLKQT